MAMVKMEHESSIGAIKAYTSYKWSLNDWLLLYYGHYAKEVASQKFLVNGLEGYTCQLTLMPYDDPINVCPRVNIEFSDDLDLLLIETTFSVVNSAMEKITTLYKNVHQNPVGKVLHSCFMGVSLSKTGIDTYLTNGTLILFAEFTIVKSIVSSPLATESCRENFGTGVRENLQEILDSKSLCDVTFVVGDKKLLAHKVILAANSDAFKAMFMSGMKEDKNDTVDIVDTEADVLEEFLNYVYSGKLNNLETMVDELIVVADKYQIHDLKALCENYMSVHLDNGNVIQRLIVAYKLCCKTLKKKAIDYLKVNMQVLANEADYRMLLEFPALIQEVFGK